VDQAGLKGNHCDNLNSATPPPCSEGEQEVLRISSVSEMYSTAVMCLCLVCDSFNLVQMFWLPFQISKISLTLAILYNINFSTAVLILKSFSVLI